MINEISQIQELFPLGFLLLEYSQIICEHYYFS
jgi:hypothetical protein